MGYTARSFAIKGYYNYSKKRPSFPYSYAVSVFRDNSHNIGLSLKGSRHYNDLVVSSYFQTQYKTNAKVDSFGGGVDGVYSINNSSLGLGLYLVEDPVTGFKNADLNSLITSNSLDLPFLDESIIATTLQVYLAQRFNAQGDVIKAYEPVFLTSIYLPDLNETQDSELQTAFGLNAYFNKGVRLRFQFDLIFTKKPTSKQSSINGSRVELGLQARF